MAFSKFFKILMSAMSEFECRAREFSFAKKSMVRNIIGTETASVSECTWENA